MAGLPLRRRARYRGAVASGAARQGSMTGGDDREDDMGRWRRRQGADAFDFVAGNGLIDRRALLGRGMTIAGAFGAAGTVTGAAAEPLTDAPWSLEVGQ